MDKKMKRYGKVALWLVWLVLKAVGYILLVPLVGVLPAFISNPLSLNHFCFFVHALAVALVGTSLIEKADSLYKTNKNENE